MQICNVTINVGDAAKCKYPMNGNRNILKDRNIKRVEATGTGPMGKYLKVELEDGTFRTFSERRIVDLELVKS